MKLLEISCKLLNSIIKPYINCSHRVRSTNEALLKISNTKIEKKTDILASLDVTSLFTNVPIKKTIDIIADKIYN